MLFRRMEDCGHIYVDKTDIVEGVFHELRSASSQELNKIGEVRRYVEHTAQNIEFINRLQSLENKILNRSYFTTKKFDRNKKNELRYMVNVGITSYFVCDHTSEYNWSTTESYGNIDIKYKNIAVIFDKELAKILLYDKYANKNKKYNKLLTIDSFNDSHIRNSIYGFKIIRNNYDWNEYLKGLKLKLKDYNTPLDNKYLYNSMLLKMLDKNIIENLDNTKAPAEYPFMCTTILESEHTNKKYYLSLLKKAMKDKKLFSTDQLVTYVADENTARKLIYYGKRKTTNG